MLDYEKLLKSAVQDNLKITLSLLENGELDIKISNFCDEYGFDFQTVKNEATQNEILRAFFAKKPNRQGFHERQAYKYVDNLLETKNCRQLPKGKKNALYLTSGDVVKAKKSGKLKSIDFYWELENNIKCFATHKYTRTGGGHQDNQYRDVQEFLRHSIDNSNKNTYFFAICDGEYYNSINGTYNLTRLDNLKRIAKGNDNSIACSIDEVQYKLKEIINKLE